MTPSSISPIDASPSRTGPTAFRGTGAYQAARETNVAPTSARLTPAPEVPLWGRQLPRAPRLPSASSQTALECLPLLKQKTAPLVPTWNNSSIETSTQLGGLKTRRLSAEETRHLWFEVCCCPGTIRRFAGTP